MIGENLRHLRAFLAVAESGSVTQAAARSYVSQPAVTQAIAKLEALAEVPLFRRSPQGFFPTEAGEILRHRASRAFAMIDPALAEIAPRLPHIATRPQLRALIATSEAQNFSLAARVLGVSQPTVHRAIGQLEREAGLPLFQRGPQGVVPTRACTALARAARLAFAELDQAEAELGELAGREVGRIVIGATPLARSYILPRALATFRAQRPRLGIKVLDGPYSELLRGLRRGEVDFMVGALRDPVPIDDVVQEALFEDTLVILAGRGHPQLDTALDVARLAAFPWLVTRENTPSRTQFDAMFDAAGVAPPREHHRDGLGHPDARDGAGRAPSRVHLAPAGPGRDRARHGPGAAYRGARPLAPHRADLSGGLAADPCAITVDPGDARCRGDMSVFSIA